MKEVFINSSIECKSAEIISRNIVPSAYIEIADIGRCFTYKCKRNSEAKILKELIPKKPIYDQNSNLELETILECEDLFVAVNVNKPYKNLKLLKHTSRHKAQTFTTKEYTYAKISKQLQNIPSTKNIKPKDKEIEG